jgi:hypothetical protein
MRRVSLLLVLASLLAQAASLEAVKSEKNPNKRAVLALDNCEAAMNEARNASNAGDWNKMAEAFQEVDASADLCYASLHETGRSPRKNPFYKRAELKLRSLLRMMQGVTGDIPYDERAAANQALEHLQEVHDKILDEEMQKR